MGVNATEAIYSVDRILMTLSTVQDAAPISIVLFQGAMTWQWRPPPSLHS